MFIAPAFFVITIAIYLQVTGEGKALTPVVEIPVPGEYELKSVTLYVLSATYHVTSSFEYNTNHRLGSSVVILTVKFKLLTITGEVENSFTQLPVIPPNDP